MQLLADASNGEIKTTAVARDGTERGGWNPWGYYHDASPLPATGAAVVEMSDEASPAGPPGHGTVFSASRYQLHTRRGVTPSAASSAGRPPLAPQTGSGKPPLGPRYHSIGPPGNSPPFPHQARQPPFFPPPSGAQKRAPLAAVRQDPNLPRVTPGRRDTTGPSKARRPQAQGRSGDENGVSDYLTPAAALLAAAQSRGTAGPPKAPTISPEDPLDRLASCNTASSSSPRMPWGAGVKRPLPAAAAVAAAAASNALQAGVAAGAVAYESVEPPAKRKPLTLGPAPLAPRVVESHEVRPYLASI